MVTTVSDESSKAYLQMCVCVFVATNICGVLERFERGFEGKFKRLPLAWERKSFYDDTTRESLTVCSLSLSHSKERSALLFRFFAFSIKFEHYEYCTVSSLLRPPSSRGKRVYY